LAAASTKPLLTLDEALNISSEDLAANRAGRLSEAQGRRLQRGWRRTLAILIAVVVIVGLIATVALFFGQRNSSSILTLVGIVLTVINAVIVGIGAQSYIRTSSDLRGGSIAEVSGVVKHTVRVSGRVATYVLTLDGQEVIVPKPVFFAIEEGKPYRLYRAPASKTVLAAEPV
jgi:uncharacterized membrane protein YidH (DUF202 family)